MRKFKIKSPFLQEFALDGSENNMNKDGSSTNKVYEVVANSAGGRIKYLQRLKFLGVDDNIYVQRGSFLGVGKPLTNGILVEFIKDSTTIFSHTLKSTVGIMGEWSTTASDQNIFSQSRGDYFISVKDLDKEGIALGLTPGSTDKIKVTIRDDLTSVTEVCLWCEGIEVDA